MNIAILTREYILQNWEDFFRRNRYSPELLEKMIDRLVTVMDHRKGDEALIRDLMIPELRESERRLIQLAMSQCPIGFFKPSWEQAQVLNAWHPEFEPEVAPEGYRSVCLFCGNQIGKTCVSVINTGLWTTPNYPDWEMFREQEDPPLYNVHKDPSSGIKRPSRGKYRVYLRPDWDRWIRTGKMTFNSEEPPMRDGNIWHGVENDVAWSDKVHMEYMKWLPKDWIAKRPDGGQAVFKQQRRIDSRWGHSITGKTFNSDIQDWAGKADLRIINIDEGIPPHLLREALMRIGGNGYFVWPYTPVEPRNIGHRAKCAWDVYKGNLKLVGKTKFFLSFSMLDAPEQVMNSQKRADNLARLKGADGEDRIRREGGFFNSSPNVFTNYERERNVLPIEGSDALLAIKGDTPQKWIEQFGRTRAEGLAGRLYQANILRGFDEGLANPSACSWQALLRTGEHMIFREWEQSDCSIDARCEAVVSRSGNTRELQNPGAPDHRRRYKEKVGPNGMEVRKTFADSKMFVRDPLSPADEFTDNYIRAGLKIEKAGSLRPGPRCDFVNDMLRADPTRQHLLNQSEHGCRLYITRDCVKTIERMENYLWQQIAQGSRMGEYTDKPENKDDHTVDAFCYPAISKLRWRDPTEDVSQSHNPTRFDQLTGAVIR